MIPFLGIVLKGDTTNPNLLQSMHKYVSVPIFTSCQIVDKFKNHISRFIEHAKVIIIVLCIRLVNWLSNNLHFFRKVVVFESMVHRTFEPLVPMILNLHWQAVKRFLYVEIHHLII